MAHDTMNMDPAVASRARAIAGAGGIEAALASGTLPNRFDTTLSEAVVLGLLKQGVRKFLAVFGHGSTDIAEILRIYDAVGATRTFAFHNEVEMAHAATMLSWQYGEIPAVVTSIGPGALQAMAGSLAAASNGVGVWHIYGDETTYGEGYNMQAIPKPEQGLYGRMTAAMGESYVLHTPEAVRAAMRRGALRTRHPYKAGPFYLLLPINRQPARIAGFNPAALPGPYRPVAMMLADQAALAEAVSLLRRHHRIAIKAGGGARCAADAVRRLAEAIGAVVMLSPGSTGVLPDAHPQNMHVGGSKGSISGNYAMAEADLLVMIGSRAVCQADCSGIGFPRAEAVINLNGDLADAQHYNRTIALVGDIGAVAGQLLAAIGSQGGISGEPKRAWLEACATKKREWREFRAARYAAEALNDPGWGGKALTQPAAIKTVADFAKRVGAIKYFDAGDVQANGFQIVEDDAPFETFTESGASYMGFAPSALLASALADKGRYGIAFCGDGSFMMNPQVLVDAVEHGARGMIVVFDNRRMGAISSLQLSQYGEDFRTGDSVGVDYCRLGEAIAGVKTFAGGATCVSLRSALEAAHAHRGLSLVHVPVYFGRDPLGGLGAYGAWNIGNWCAEVQARWQEQNL